MSAGKFLFAGFDGQVHRLKRNSAKQYLAGIG
jgi:hypothetical protein